MRRSLSLTFVAAVAFMTLSGCGTHESDIVGAWKVDVEATKSQISSDLKAKNVPQNMIDLQESEVQAGAGMMNFEFKADKTATAIGGMTATWKLDGDKVVLNGEGGTPMTMDYKGGKLYFRPDASGGAIVLEKSK